ncbi:MAG: hypothetical protein V4598_10415 [Bdellovibrionota bacterium]
MSFWNVFRGSDPREYFLKFDPAGSIFSSVTWNFDLMAPGQRRFMVEILKEKKETIDWHRSDVEEVKFAVDGKISRKRRIPRERAEYVKLMNLAMHATIISGIESHKEFVTTPVTGVTTLDYESEGKALQWIQASFGTLSRALKKIKNEEGMFLTGAFFSGLEPSSEDKVLRLIAFNLDIIFYFQKDGSMRILVFDDKNMGHGQSRNPSFQQIIKVTKPQFYDEIIKLIHEVATVGELK